MRVLGHVLPVLLMALTFAMVHATAQAEGSSPQKALALRGIMQGMEANTEAVAGAISREDWKAVVELAPKIAHHPEPPILEKAKILLWLNVDALNFRGYDTKVKEAALAMGDAAQKGDRNAAVADFARLQQSCLGCHQAYRQKFIDHFYGQ